MMRRNFWHGLVFGTLAATAFNVLLGPLQKIYKKPFVERGAQAASFTAHDFAKKARRVKRRMMKKF
ncbi:hypothetical protein Ga0466249_002026 [Sporomusaceae bacterium BoRhaA]|uniref:hypothetical protein n=1 Tax=Pelorhabdus rhamnosifermentans TaxID=2772457 RepID=UPI001C063D8D|nr:hypothetical protein [Pelorhabdus rhamnosifermentans]MBU2700915.1 hypothetical protein [Pelorhabdus rhamnosifermentans]